MPVVSGRFRQIYSRMRIRKLCQFTTWQLTHFSFIQVYFDFGTQTYTKLDLTWFQTHPNKVFVFFSIARHRCERKHCPSRAEVEEEQRGERERGRESRSLATTAGVRLAAETLYKEADGVGLLQLLADKTIFFLFQTCFQNLAKKRKT